MSETEQFYLDQVVYYRQDDRHIERGKFLSHGERDHPPHPGQLRIYGGPHGAQKYILVSSVLKECPCADCGTNVPLNPYYTHWHEDLPYCSKCWRKFPFIRTYDNFWLACLDPEAYERTCGYWYTITSGSFAHTAFYAVEELMDWVDVRGLRLMASLPPERGTYKSIRIDGSYRTASYLDVNVFRAIQPILEIAFMDNARWIPAKVTQDGDGIRTIHHLNCNVNERIGFLYDDEKEGADEEK